MKGFNCEQLRVLKLKTIMKIVEREDMIEFNELYGRMAIDFGITKKKMKEYLEVLNGAKKVIVTENITEGKKLTVIKSLKYGHLMNTPVEIEKHDEKDNFQ